jgi:NADH-quinone oxidoreductase subunit H
MLFDALILLAKLLGVFAFMLLAVLLMIWFERRVVALIQSRLGPNRLGPFGLFQSLADALKFFFKEQVQPSNADRILYLLAPVIVVIPALTALSVIPFGTSFGSEPAILADINVGLLFVLAMGSLHVYGVVLAGYASGSNYPLLGGVRSSAQMVSYEIAQGLSLVGVFMAAGTLTGTGIVAAQSGPGVVDWLPNWFIVPQLPLFLVFVIAGVAETNRAPFDLPEAESELTGGYHTEYSGLTFAWFFLAEYMNMIVVSAVAVTAFLGGPDGPVFGFLPWLWPMLWFLLKVGLFLFLFVWLRGTLPRLSYDALMSFGWKVLIPVAFIWIAVTGVMGVVGTDNLRGWLFAAAGVLALLLVVTAVGGAIAGRSRTVSEGTPS